MQHAKRLDRAEEALAPQLAAPAALSRIARILDVDQDQLKTLTRTDWWNIMVAIGEGDLHGETISDEEWAQATREQLERIRDGGRPSVVLNAA